jgi:phosphate uptake regulator
VKADDAPEEPAMYRRESLKARMAGNIASGLAMTITIEATERERERVADSAVDIAERILKRCGL